MVGLRYLPRTLLDALFEEELPVLKDAGIIGDWIEEARKAAEREGLQVGSEQGLQQGLAEGRALEARRLVNLTLTERFGPLPAALHARIGSADGEWCERLLRRAVKAESLQELSWESL